MPTFDFSEFTGWTLYVTATYTAEDKYLICEFLPSNTVQVPTSLTAGLSNIWENIFSANMHTETWDFIVSKGLPLFHPASTVLPYKSGGNAPALSDVYFIESVIPGGFVPLFVSAGMYPGSFRHERFAIVYIKANERADTTPPTEHVMSPVEIMGEDFFVYRPPSTVWTGLPVAEEIVLEDGDLYYWTFLPHYPYKGKVWIKQGFTFPYSSQASSFWADMDEDWEFFSLPWGQPDTPTEYLFNENLMPHFWLDSSVYQWWILGDNEQERHDERHLLQDTLKEGYDPEFWDGHTGTMDRFYWFLMKCTFPDNDFRMSIHNRLGSPPLSDPDWWRGWFKAKWYDDTTAPGTSLFIRKKGPGPYGYPIAPTLLTFSPFGIKFPDLPGLER